MNQFCPFQIDTKFNIFYKNYSNIFSKIDIFINYFWKGKNCSILTKIETKLNKNNEYKDWIEQK